MLAGPRTDRRSGVLAGLRAVLATMGLLVAGPTLAQEASFAWSEASPMPTARSEMQAAVLDGLVYVPGGLGPDRALDVVETYDPVAGVWREAPPLPAPVHHAGVAAADGRVFVSGGYADLRFVPGSTLWAFDPVRRRWERLPDLPAPRAGHALVALDGALYVIGGLGRTSQAVWRFDLATERWTEPAARIPTVREHLAAVVLDGRIWTIGGRWPERGNVGTVEVYDPATDRWAPGPDLPTPRSGLTAGVLDGRIHVVGGEALSGGRTFEQHEVYDPATGSWATAPPLRPARHGLASAVAGERWYLIGGATRAGGGTFDSLVDRVSVGSGAVEPEADRSSSVSSPR